ncbi:ATP-grasp domain-containing protein [Lederbergia citrisecunda]|uniref:ATP-grasp domain-containing protein n=2 Tax=Bacillales TaxID=1385 RepID=UPI003D28D2E3
MNILFTSAGRRSYLVNFFKEALNGKGKVHVANSSRLSTAMISGDYSIVAPSIYEKEYIPFLKNYCLQNEIQALIPLFDLDLLILSRHKKDFEEIGVQVIVSSEEVIAICNDKWESYNFLRKKGFNTPTTFLKVNDALKAVKQGEIHFPLMIKPRWGMGSISIFEADNIDELTVFYQRTLKTIQSTYLSYEALQNADACIIIQEKLEGQEYGLDIINNLQGDYEVTVSKEKIAMRSGETDCAEVVYHEGLEKVGEKLSNILKHIGNLDVDAFMVNGNPYILELNARFGGGYPFSHIAGVNLPKAIIQWLKGETVEKELLKPQIGVIGFKELTMAACKTPTSSL